ncbi:MAG: WYL domain-containing protein [Candidatus Gastranaerophilales bacterium]|nr:WYL domain-containing protein [Candidatus Gastranaerophilales bacterium]
MNKKINKTAYTFLLCFKYILEKRIFKIDDIIEYLENNFNIIIFSETVLKYIRTMKKAGIKFSRLNNKTYELKELPFDIDFTDEERNILFKSFEFKDFYIAGNFYDFKELIDKLNVLCKYRQTDFYKIIKAYKVASDLKKYCEDELRLKIHYDNNGQEITDIIEPKELVIISKIIYLKCYNVTQKANALININNIIRLKQTPVKNKNIFIEQFVKLTFTGKLVNTYVLKESEEIIKKTDNELIIKSYYYDKLILFKNILKYMDSCEILEPQNLREEFYNYVKEIILIYW